MAIRLDGSAYAAASIGGGAANTIGFWLRPAAYPAAGNRACICNRQNSANDNEYYHDHDFFLTDTGVVKLRVYDGGVKLVATAVALTRNRWYHVAGTTDGSSLKIYLDGLLSGQIPCGTGGADSWITIARLADSLNDGESARERFVGDLAGLFVSSSIHSGLELSQIALQRRDPATLPGLIGHWPLAGQFDMASRVAARPSLSPTGVKSAAGPPVLQPARRRLYRTAGASSPRSLSAAMDAAIQATRSLAPPLDAAVEAARAAQAVLDAGIARALALGAALDAQVQIPTAALAGLDAAIGASRNAAAGLDAGVAAARSTAAGLDAGIAHSATGGAGLDAALRAARAATSALDAAVRSALAAAVGLDAFVLASLLSVGLDAYVVLPGGIALPADLWLAEIAAAIDEAGTLTTHRYSSGPGYNHPSAPGYYEPRILQPMNLRRDLFAAGTVGGRSEAGAGELVLANPDGALDPLLEQGLDGRDLTVKLVARAGPYESALTVLRGTMQQAEGSLADLRLKIRDRQQELEIPLPLDRYGGTNESGVGADGGPDLKDKPKPKAFGEVFNIEPVAVNPSRLIYQLHDGWIEAVTAVRDKGVVLAPGSERATLADLAASAPAPGSFDYCLGATGDGAFIRLGSTPAGGIRADLQGDKRGGVYRETVADLAVELAETFGAIAAADIVAADVVALNAKNAATVGLWVDGEIRVAEALDRLCRSIGAWWGFDRLGRFRLGRLEAPTGDPALTLRRFAAGTATTPGDADLLELERLAGDDADAVPAWRVTIGFKPNWAPQSPDDLAGSVDDETRAILAAADRSAVAEDASVKAKHRLAGEPVISTVLASRAGAEAEAARQLALLKVRRARYRCRIKADAGTLGAVELAAPALLRVPRFGLDGGALLTILGLDYAPAEGFLDLTLWG